MVRSLFSLPSLVIHDYLGCCITEYLWLGINSKSISRLEFSSPSKTVKNHCRRSRVSASDPSDNLCSLQTLGPRGSSLSRDSITFTTVGNSSEFWDSGTHTGRGKKKRDPPRQSISLTFSQWNRALLILRRVSHWSMDCGSSPFSCEVLLFLPL